MANEEIRQANVEIVLQTAITLFIENGIENTTREMIARASGLSRRSTERYFPTKTECVVQAAEWFGRQLYEKSGTRKMLQNPESLGSDILRSYLEEVKGILLKEQRVFACYAEFKAHLYRNSEHRDVDYRRFAEAVGCRKMLQSIFERGREDHTVYTHTTPESNARYLTNSIMSYFSNVVLLYDTDEELMRQYIDTYIEDTWNQYCGDWLFLAM
jgi:AcrR family transcriptional regulator